MSADTVVIIWIGGIVVIATVCAWVFRLRFDDFSEDLVGFSAMMLLIWPLVLICLITIAVGAILVSPALLVMHFNERRKRKNDELQQAS